MKKYILSLFLFIYFNSLSDATSYQKDSTLNFIPDNRIFPAIFLDPLECQTMGGSYFLTRDDRDLSLYSTVNLGFNKPVLGKQGENISWEFNFGAAVFSQFDLIKEDNGSYLAGLMNTDFKLSGDYTIQKKNNIMRLRIFHISSHLGDDYIQRNQDTLVNDKSVNYEQIDLTYLRKFGNSFFYAGTGYIYTINVFRERLSFQGGGLLNFGKPGSVNLFTGMDLKLLAENDFKPDIKTAIGVSFNRRSESLIRIWLEYYSGQLPYSTIEYGRVNWFGMALRLNFYS
jgi:hypothetical protein